MLNSWSVTMLTPYLLETMQHTFCYSIPHLLLRTGPTLERARIMLTTYEEDINITTISPITQRCSTYTKSHCLVSPLLSNRSGLFPVESPRAGFQYHHKRDFILFDRVSTTSLYTSPCGHKFHVFTYHPHPTFTTPLFGSVFRIQLEV